MKKFILLIFLLYLLTSQARAADCNELYERYLFYDRETNSSLARLNPTYYESSRTSAMDLLNSYRICKLENEVALYREGFKQIQSILDAFKANIVELDQRLQRLEAKK